MAEQVDDALWSPVASNTVDVVSEMNKAREANSTLDKDAFLMLLVTQMQYQDPLNPMDDKEFLGQMAQFTALEQMQNLSKTFANQQAYSMIGQEVYAYYQDEASGEFKEVTGVVDAVTLKNGEAYLYVNGNDVPASSVSIVGGNQTTSSKLDEIYSSVSNTRNQGYVGKYIQALLVDAEGNVTDYVEGRVDYVKQSGKDSVLVVGNKEVFPQEVASVSDKPLLLGKQINVEVKNADGSRTRYENVPIDGVVIKNNSAYLQAGGQEVLIDKINYVMEALNFVGTAIDHGSVSGTVDSVTVKYGMAYLNVGDQEVSYIEYLADSIEAADTDGE